MHRTAMDLSALSPSRLQAQSTHEARALDLAATAELGVPSVLLMENAARSAAIEVHRLLDDGEVLVLAGKGNNGGDGLAIARFLAPRARVALLGEPDPERSPDAALQLRILAAARVPVVRGPEAKALGRLAANADVIVDALLGTGLESAPRGEVADWIRWANEIPPPILAVDLPSGLSADTGEAFDPCVEAALTVTFARPKRGLLVGDGPRVAGRVVVGTLGLPEDWVEARDAV